MDTHRWRPRPSARVGRDVPKERDLRTLLDVRRWNDALRALIGVPVGYVWLAAAWYVMYMVTTVVGPAGLVSLVFDVICFGLLLFRPSREIPAALLLLSTTLNDEMMFLGAILVWVRVAFGAVEVDGRLTARSLLIVAFLFSAVLSAILGYDPADPRPWQFGFWLVTFMIPFSLQFLRVRDLGPEDQRGILRFAVALLVMQSPILLMEGIRTHFDDADAFAGAGAGAAVIGFWATAIFVGALAAAILNPGPVRRSLWVVLAFGLVVTKLADSKVYSLLVLGCGCLLIGLRSLRVMSRPRASSFVVIGLAGVLAAGLLAWRAWPTISVLADLNYAASKKVMFLERAFDERAAGYDDLFGVGPGMMGSRAANLVSGDVQFKIKDSSYLPAFLRRNAPAPERWAMRDLWDEDLYLQSQYFSSTLIMPFSGIGAIKGELGWSGLLLFVALAGATALSALLLPLRPRPSPLVLAVSYAYAAGVLAMVLIAIFDSAWEMPKLVLPLGAIAMALHSAQPKVAGRRRGLRHPLRLRRIASS